MTAEEIHSIAPLVSRKEELSKIVEMIAPPNSIVLLSGDFGSGKTSILLSLRKQHNFRFVDVHDLSDGNIEQLFKRISRFESGDVILVDEAGSLLSLSENILAKVFESLSTFKIVFSIPIVNAADQRFLEICQKYFQNHPINIVRLENGDLRKQAETKNPIDSL